MPLESSPRIPDLRTDPRVEVAQQQHLPLAPARRDITEDLLDHEFGATIEAGRPECGILVEWRLRSIPVCRGRRPEHPAVHFRALHRRSQCERAGDVVVAVTQRLLYGFADRLQAGEVNDCRDSVCGKYGVECLGVADVSLGKSLPAPGDASDSPDHRAAAV